MRNSPFVMLTQEVRTGRIIIMYIFDANDTSWYRHCTLYTSTAPGTPGINEHLPTSGQAFRFIVDEQDVTAGGDTVWKVDSTTAPKNGTLCFAPANGLAVGVHTAAVGVQDSTNVQAPFKQVVAWKFEVTQ